MQVIECVRKTFMHTHRANKWRSVRGRSGERKTPLSAGKASHLPLKGKDEIIIIIKEKGNTFGSGK